MPFPISTGVVWVHIVVSPCTVHHKYLIYSFKANHHRGVKPFSRHSGFMQMLLMVVVNRVVPSSTVKGQLPSIIINIPYRTKVFIGINVREIRDCQNRERFKPTKSISQQVLVA